MAVPNRSRHSRGTADQPLGKSFFSRWLPTSTYAWHASLVLPHIFLLLNLNSAQFSIRSLATAWYHPAVMCTKESQNHTMVWVGRDL